MPMLRILGSSLYVIWFASVINVAHSTFFYVAHDVLTRMCELFLLVHSEFGNKSYLHYMVYIAKYNGIYLCYCNNYLILVLSLLSNYSRWKM